MLSREWCVKLKEKGYPIRGYRDQGTRFENIIIPSGDELKEECVKLFPNQMWTLKQTVFYDGRTCTTLCDGDPDRTVMLFHACSKGETNADLAQAWIWLKERKDAQ